MFVVFENHKHGIVIVLLKNIQGQDNIENIWVKCLVKCTQANFKAKVQIDAFLHIKKNRLHENFKTRSAISQDPIQERAIEPT